MPVRAIVHKISDFQNATIWPFNKIKTSRSVLAFPRADGIHYFAHPSGLATLSAFARINIGDVNNGLEISIKNLCDLIDIRTRIEIIANVQPLQILIAIQLLVIS